MHCFQYLKLSVTLYCRFIGFFGGNLMHWGTDLPSSHPDCLIQLQMSLDTVTSASPGSQTSEKYTPHNSEAFRLSPGSNTILSNKKARRNYGESPLLVINIDSVRCGHQPALPLLESAGFLLHCTTGATQLLEGTALLQTTNNVRLTDGCIEGQSVTRNGMI